MTPRITIITPSFNRANFIRQAIESVLSQDYSDFEHIVIDGNSFDGTANVLNEYPHLLTVVESDHGLYDAINKGLRMSKGQIIGLLNSDDYYAEGVFREVSTIFEADDTVDVVIGQAGIFESMTDGHFLVDRYPSLGRDVLLDRLIFGAPSINAWFFRYTLFDRVGYFDLAYPIGADRDFLIRLYLSSFTPAFVNKIYYHYRRHPGSLTINQGLDAQERVLLENRRLAQKYVSNCHQDAILRNRSKLWHDLTSIELMILFTRQRKLLDLFDVVQKAVKQNWRWPFIVAAQSPARIINYLKKQYAANR